MFYSLDLALGTMSVRVGTCMPSTLAVFLYWHGFLAQELT